MGTFFTLVFNQFVSYAEKNPAVLEELIGQAVIAGLNALKTANATSTLPPQAV